MLTWLLSLLNALALPFRLFGVGEADDLLKVFGKEFTDGGYHGGEEGLEEYSCVFVFSFVAVCSGGVVTIP